MPLPQTALLGYCWRTICEYEDPAPAQLTFARLVGLLERPPFEPCDSELKYLSPADYDESFTEVVRLYHRQIRRHVERITEDYTNADDLTQEVFIKVYRARASFEKAYIYCAATNTAINYLRLRSRQRRVLYAHWKNIRLEMAAKSEVPDPQLLPDAEFVERAREEALAGAVLQK